MLATTQPMNVASFRRQLLLWFGRNRRDLPWRRHPEVYRVWVSEVMLQQTQVDTVVGYFNRFIERFPDIQSLAKAEIETVLRYWEGLGYYRRARQLHLAAKQIVARHNGRFPTDFEHVISLPGIGRYTAGAILSIGDQQQHPVLEGNTIRLYSRLLNFRGNVRSPEGQKLLWSFAEKLVPKKGPGDFNQALMELGSQVCRKGKPLCEACPVRRHCLGLAAGEPQKLPNIGPDRKRYEVLHYGAVILERRGRFFLRRYPEGEKWAGLWDFPRFVLPETHDSPGAKRFLEKSVRELSGLTVRLAAGDYPLIRHAVTRYRITLVTYRGESISGRLRSDQNKGEIRWVNKADLPDLPMNTTGRRIANMLRQQGIAD
jgi:A/G-specific adenine glycosylase